MVGTTRRMKPKFPSQVLQECIGKEICIKLKDDTEYKGIARDIDIYMNIVLENPIEYMDGKEIARYTELYIRGNSIFYVKLNSI